MKFPFRLVMFAWFMFAGSVMPAAETRPALVGEYAGTWSSNEGAGGELRVALRQDASAKWVADASFAYEGARIATTMKSVSVDGAKVTIVFDWVVQGTAGQSTLSGELTGETLRGSYASRGAEGESSGTWTAKRG